jgi:serine protease
VTLDTVAELQADIASDSYSFSFENVSPGSYLIVAGTDSDNDNIICDAGEACGAYPARDELVPIEIQSDMTNLDFTTGFSTAFEAESLGGGGGGGFARPGPRKLAGAP